MLVPCPLGEVLARYKIECEMRDCNAAMIGNRGWIISLKEKLFNLRNNAEILAIKKTGSPRLNLNISLHQQKPENIQSRIQ